MTDPNHPIDPDLDGDLREIHGLLTPLRSVTPPQGHVVRWREHLRLMRAFPGRFQKRAFGLSRKAWGWILLGNLSAVAVLAMFLPMGQVSHRGHILSFEVNAGSRDAKASLASLPWLRGAAYGISRETNEQDKRTRLHLVLIDKTEQEVARWAEDLLATPSVLKVKIVPVMVDDHRRVGEHLYEGAFGHPLASAATRQKALEHRVSDQLRHLAGPMPLRLGSNQLVADAFDKPIPDSGLAMPAAFPSR